MKVVLPYPVQNSLICLGLVFSMSLLSDEGLVESALSNRIMNVNLPQCIDVKWKLVESAVIDPVDADCR